MNDQEWFDSILVHYKLKPQNPRDRDSPMISEFDLIEYRPVYTLPFNETNLQKLYDMGNGRCALVLQDEGDIPPVFVESFEAFKSRPFDELYEMIITPRYRMDRSYRGNLDNSHIG